MKILDTTASNSLFTWDKTINNTYNLYSAIKNDTILVNFGDSSQASYQLNSGLYFYNKNFNLIRLLILLLSVVIPNYVIPRFIATPSINMNSSFLILNNEIHNQTNLFGFTLYAAVNGSINIMVLF